MNRRAFVTSSGAAAAALAGISSKPAGAAASPPARMKLGCQSAPTNEQHVAYFARYGVQGIPLLVLIRERSERDRLVGAVPLAQLRAWLAPHLTAAHDAAGE